MNTKTYFCACLVTILCSLGMAVEAAVPLEELFYKGKAIPFYGSTSSQRHAQMLASLKNSRMAERMASLTQASLRLKANLGIGFESCGQANAYFDPQQSRIVFCLEMLELIVQQSQKDPDLVGKIDKGNFGKLMDGVLWGIYFHELGHAVIGINRVAITGREEDVADQFALYYAVNFIEPRDVPVILPTIWFFKSLSKERDIGSSTQEALKRLLADEHSLDDQRTYSLACWAFGADQTRGRAALDFVGLPEQRAVRCPGEYLKLAEGFKSRFKKYLIINRPQ